MSKAKAQAAIVPDEEWEDAGSEEDEELEEEEEEEDTTLYNPEVVNKYKKAAAWANEALKNVISLCKAGANIQKVCMESDEFINKKVTTMFKGVDKGVAFPTTLSVNNCVAYQCDTPGEDPSADARCLAMNDVVHIDLSVHVDGYCAPMAYTMQVTENGELKSDSREAAIISAAYQTLDTVVRQMRPGTDPYEVTKVVEECAAHFGFTPVDGCLSHTLKRYIIDGHECVANSSKAEFRIHSYEIGAMTAWAMEVLFTTGKGKLREGDGRSGIFKPTYDQDYTPKMNAAQELTKEVDKKFGVFPFAVRSLETKKARLGLTELIKHGNMHKFSPIVERDGEVVAHFKITILVTAKKIERINGVPPQKGAPAPKPYESESLKAAAAKKFAFVDKKPAAAAVTDKAAATTEKPKEKKQNLVD